VIFLGCFTLFQLRGEILGIIKKCLVRKPRDFIRLLRKKHGESRKGHHA